MLPFVLLVVAATAQQPVMLHGRIADDVTSVGIAFVDVELIDGLGYVVGRTRTDPTGEFSFRVRRPGGYYLRTHHPGYEEATSPALRLGQHDVVHVEMRLAVNAVLLAPLEIVARSPARSSPVLDSYRARLRSGLGTFITRAEIESRQPGYVTDLLATLPGVRLEYTAGGSNSRVVYMARGQSCPADLYVDGMRVSRGAPVSIDELVSPPTVEAIEVYRGLSTIPAEFLSSESSRCGVVAIWTRRGDNT